jgi:hypothetical protein
MLNSPNISEHVKCFLPCVFKSPTINFAIFPPKCDLANSYPDWYYTVIINKGILLSHFTEGRTLLQRNMNNVLMLFCSGRKHFFFLHKQAVLLYT